MNYINCTREVRKLIHVYVDGEEINTTDTHPFWVEGKGWTEAGELKAGDVLRLNTGELKTVEKVEIEVFDKPVKVYNFEVEDWHTYFVTEQGILVHNAGQDYDGNGNTGTPNKETSKTGNIKNIYNSIKEAPKYPEGFRGIQNGTKKVNINNHDVLNELRQIEPGQWKKVYKDGFDAIGNKVSIHYFESPSGKVFDVKVKSGWSNR